VKLKKVLHELKQSSRPMFSLRLTQAMTSIDTDKVKMTIPFLSNIP